MNLATFQKLGAEPCEVCQQECAFGDCPPGCEYCHNEPFPPLTDIDGARVCAACAESWDEMQEEEQRFLGGGIKHG